MNKGKWTNPLVRFMETSIPFPPMFQGEKVVPYILVFSFLPWVKGNILYFHHGNNWKPMSSSMSQYDHFATCTHRDLAGTTADSTCQDKLLWFKYFCFKSCRIFWVYYNKAPKTIWFKIREAYYVRTTKIKVQSQHH